MRFKITFDGALPFEVIEEWIKIFREDGWKCSLVGDNGNLLFEKEHELKEHKPEARK